MLKNVGATWVIIGGGTDKSIGRNVLKILKANLKVMISLGGTSQEREDGQIEAIDWRQMEAIGDAIDDDNWSNIALIYQPVWMNGTHQNVPKESIQVAHFFISKWLTSDSSQLPRASLSTRYRWIHCRWFIVECPKRSNCKQLLKDFDQFESSHQFICVF